jgi:hypothetical protein
MTGPANHGPADGGPVDDPTAPAEPTPHQRRALFRVLRGTPTDEELAALTAVLLVTAAAADRPPPPAPRNHWSDPATRMRRPLTPGPGAWRASALPH